MNLSPIHLFELRFRVLKPINRLPHYHGPHWSALFRTLLRAGLPAGEKLVEAVWVQPVETGIMSFEPGEPLHLGLTCPAVVLPALTSALAKWDSLSAAGHFQPATLAFEGAFCRVSGRLFDPTTPCCFDESIINGEISALEKLDAFTLQLTSPMRLTRPEGCKQERHRYCDSDFFFEGYSNAAPHPLQAILGRLRLAESPIAETDGISMNGGTVTWLDVPYGSSSSKTLGGLVGALCFNGTPSPALARLLVLGQYLGAGKNAAFGFGFYSIPELDDARSIAPLRRGMTLLQRGTRRRTLNNPTRSAQRGISVQ
jgi:hypothetical protein